jgi:hypothetical protein
MSYGFSIYSGSGTLVETISSDTAPGVLVDSFYIVWSNGYSITKSYPDFKGSELLVSIVGSGYSTGMTISVNNSTKSVTITCFKPLGPTPIDGNVLVLGI